MTDPLPDKEPVPLSPPSQPITGDSHGHLIAALIAHAGQLGYGVEMRDLPDNGPGGWCDPKRKQIIVVTGPANRQVRALVHELAHAHGLGYELGRERCEVLVDCVIFWREASRCGLGAGRSVGDGRYRRALACELVQVRWADTCSSWRELRPRRPLIAQSGCGGPVPHRDHQRPG